MELLFVGLGTLAVDEAGVVALAWSDMSILVGVVMVSFRRCVV
jgi:hypothetical protein